MDNSDVLLYYEYDNSGTVDFWRKGHDGEWLYEGCMRQVRKITTSISTRQTIFRAKSNSLVLHSVAPIPDKIIKQSDDRLQMLKSRDSS
jgi:hypothetical protein